MKSQKTKPVRKSSPKAAPMRGGLLQALNQAQPHQSPPTRQEQERAAQGKGRC